MPNSLREASFALGVSKWRTVLLRDPARPSAAASSPARRSPSRAPPARRRRSCSRRRSSCRTRSSPIRARRWPRCRCTILIVLGVAGHEPERPGVGGGVHPDDVRARLEPDRALPPVAAASGSSGAGRRAFTGSSPDRHPGSAHSPGTGRLSSSATEPPTRERANENAVSFAGTSRCCLRSSCSPAASRRAPRRARARSDSARRRRQHVRLAARLAVAVGLSAAQTGVNIVYQPIGSGGGHPGDHEPHGRLRRLGRAAHAGSVHRLQGLLPDSVGARRRPRSWSTSRRTRTRRCTITGPVLAKIYLGQITNWDDPAIKALNPGIDLPEREDHAGLPLRRLGHVVQLHRLPVVGQRRVEVEDRRLDAAARSRSASAARARPVSPASSRTPTGAIGYADIAYAITNQIQVMAVKNAAGKFIDAGHQGDHGGGQRRHRRCRRTARCTSSTRRSRTEGATRSAPTRT